MRTGARDISTGIILLIFCILGYISTVGFSDPDTSYGPEFFPKLILVSLAILSLSLTIKGCRNLTKGESKQAFDKKIFFLILSYIILLIIYINLFFITGFIISTIIFLIVGQYLFGLRKWLTLFLIAIIVPFALYYIFTALFNIPLP